MDIKFTYEHNMLTSLMYTAAATHAVQCWFTISQRLTHNALHSPGIAELRFKPGQLCTVVPYATTILE